MLALSIGRLVTSKCVALHRGLSYPSLTPWCKAPCNCAVKAWSGYMIRNWSQWWGLREPVVAGMLLVLKMGSSHKVLGLGGGGDPVNEARMKLVAWSDGMSMMPLGRRSHLVGDEGAAWHADLCGVVLG